MRQCRPRAQILVQERTMARMKQKTDSTTCHSRADRSQKRLCHKAAYATSIHKTPQRARRSSRSTFGVPRLVTKNGASQSTVPARTTYLEDNIPIRRHRNILSRIAFTLRAQAESSHVVERRSPL